MATVGGVCAAPLTPSPHLPTLTGTPGSAETVILTDPARLPGTAAQKAALADALTTFADQVDGAVVDLGQSQRVQALQAQADDPDVITCPYAKNLVAEAGREIVNSYRDGGDTLKYVVVIGDDSVVPFFRYPDNAGLGPESGYAPPVADDTASEASLRSNYTLGQDAYGALTDLSIKGSVVPLPDLSVGRLVESPTDITAALQRFTARAGAPLTPTLDPGHRLRLPHRRRRPGRLGVRRRHPRRPARHLDHRRRRAADHHHPGRSVPAGVVDGRRPAELAVRLPARPGLPGRPLLGQQHPGRGLRHDGQQQ